jgi:hypothetical protein
MKRPVRNLEGLLIYSRCRLVVVNALAFRTKPKTLKDLVEISPFRG